MIQVGRPGIASKQLRALYLAAPAEAVARARKLLRDSDLKIRVHAPPGFPKMIPEGTGTCDQVIAGWPDYAPYPP